VGGIEFPFNFLKEKPILKYIFQVFSSEFQVLPHHFSHFFISLYLIITKIYFSNVKANKVLCNFQRSKYLFIPFQPQLFSIPFLKKRAFARQSQQTEEQKLTANAICLEQ